MKKVAGFLVDYSITNKEVYDNVAILHHLPLIILLVVQLILTKQYVCLNLVLLKWRSGRY